VERVVELLGDDSFQPRPVQARIPLTIGAHGEDGLALAARHADRWNSWGGSDLEPDEAIRRGRERNERLDHLCLELGREPASLTRSILLGYPFVRETPWRSEEAFLEVAGRWREAGFDELVVYYPPETGMPPGAVVPGVFERAIELVREV
jgi:alkanesulfonate monooxygenase SsuD/methylene tetrahydromethanopterin reductase-like flavin-dependent oxidoreductase (luciferase family)